MIPKTNNILNNNFVEQVQPSKNYKMFLNDEVVNSYADELAAMPQVIFKILNTERYGYNIYSKNYGIELEDLFGEPVSYVVPELKRRIIEALTQDDRIDSVDSFTFGLSKKRIVNASFVAHTIFGDVDGTKGVNI